MSWYGTTALSWDDGSHCRIAGEDDYQPYISGGATLAISENLILGAGAVVGLNDDANDLQVFSGFTVRF